VSQGERKDVANKKVYKTLAAAIKARSGAARKRGDRWRRQLRIYRTPQGWCLTKATKSNFEHNSTNL
jgi:hypothetical protein